MIAVIALIRPGQGYKCRYKGPPNTTHFIALVDRVSKILNILLVKMNKSWLSTFQCSIVFYFCGGVFFSSSPFAVLSRLFFYRLLFICLVFYRTSTVSVFYSAMFNCLCFRTSKVCNWSSFNCSCSKLKLTNTKLKKISSRNIISFSLIMNLSLGLLSLFFIHWKGKITRELTEKILNWALKIENGGLGIRDWGLENSMKLVGKY